MSDSLGSSHYSIGSTSSRLLERARSWDPDAWRRLVGLYGRLVLYWCARAGLQRADRGDVSQEVFRAVAKHIVHFQGDRPNDTFRGWLRTVTQSKITDYYRREGRQPRAAGGSDAYRILLGIHDIESDQASDVGNPTERSMLVYQAMKRVREEFEDRTWQAFLRTAVDGLSDELTAALRRLATAECEIESQEVDALVGHVKSPDDVSGCNRVLPEQSPMVFDRLGDYQLLARIGHGGMGVVYKARHIGGKQPVALKILAPHRMHNQRAQARFRREMKALKKLHHPNIVRAHCACEADGWNFLVMDLLDGPNLSRLVQWGGPISAGDACETIRQAANGLQHAHQRGLVHRDVKPSNLMLTADGTVKLLDLGLARLRTEEAEGGGAETNFPGSPRDSVGTGTGTGTGQLLGSLDYMAPEQRWNSRDADARADIYSLGCTLHFLLTGEPPSLNRWHERSRACDGLVEVPALSTLMADTDHDIPQELVAVLDRMTARLPNERFATMSEVAEALASLGRESNVTRLLENWQFRSRAMVERYCAILGVDADASQSEIRKMHRLLAVKFHPDLNPGDPTAAKKFGHIQHAFEMLCDPRQQERKGAFHTVASAFLTVRVFGRGREPSPMSGGIGSALIAMATVLCVVLLCVTFFLAGISSTGPTSTMSDLQTDSPSTPVTPGSILPIVCFEIGLYVCFVVIVLLYNP